MILAHIMGVPVEEFVIPWLAGGVGATVATLLAIVRQGTSVH